MLLCPNSTQNTDGICWNRRLVRLILDQYLIFCQSRKICDIGWFLLGSPRQLAPNHLTGDIWLANIWTEMRYHWLLHPFPDWVFLLSLPSPISTRGMPSPVTVYFCLKKLRTLMHVSRSYPNLHVSLIIGFIVKQDTYCQYKTSKRFKGCHQPTSFHWWENVAAIHRPYHTMGPCTLYRRSRYVLLLYK